MKCFMMGGVTRQKLRGLQRIYFLFILITFIELVLKIGDETLLTVICQMNDGIFKQQFERGLSLWAG